MMNNDYFIKSFFFSSWIFFVFVFRARDKSKNMLLENDISLHLQLTWTEFENVMFWIVTIDWNWKFQLNGQMSFEIVIDRRWDAAFNLYRATLTERFSPRVATKSAFWKYTDATLNMASSVHSSYQSMLQQLISEGFIRQRWRNLLPAGLIVRTMWRFRWTRWKEAIIGTDNSLFFHGSMQLLL